MRIKKKLLTAGCIAVSAAALLVGLSCNEHEMAPFSKSLSSGAKQSVSSGKTRAVDILFVVDNSNSMRAEQLGLDQNFGKFLDQLIQSNADYHLGVVSTDVEKTKGRQGNQVFRVQAYHEEENKKFEADLIESTSGTATPLDHDDVNALIQSCSDYYGQSKKKYWIESTDEEMEKGCIAKPSTDEEEAERRECIKKNVHNLFRCQFMLGTDGNGIEQGLANVKSALTGDDAQFKRNGSLLAIVFVTDENDCSNNSSEISKDTSADDTARCETYRNIEDSCTLAHDDFIDMTSDFSSTLKVSSGQLLVLKDGGEDIPSKTLRQWCVQGDDEARSVLKRCFDAYHSDDPTKCGVGRYINCPEGGCKDGELTHRRDFFNFLVKDVVLKTNERYYKSENPGFEYLNDDEKFALAKSDVIVASIINRDRGTRYDTSLDEAWCGDSGTQGYRYQLFAEMFDNDPIYAPICCMGDEGFFTNVSGESQPVCSQDASFGDLSQFGPVLGSIGRRIGEAVNTLCTDSAPITCDPAECRDSAGATATCPCNHGCSENAYLIGTPSEYHLCNEFEVRIGTIPSLSEYDAKNEAKVKEAYDKYEAYGVNDFQVEYESNYCLARTGSPIQIKLNRIKPGRDLIIEYPKKVSSNN